VPSFVPDASAQALDGAAFAFVIETLLPRGTPRTRGYSLLAGLRGLFEEFDESLECCLAISPLTAAFLRLDDDQPVRANARIAEREQPFEHGGWNVPAPAGVKTQVNGRGDFVDVLAAGTACPYRVELDFVERDRQFVGDLQEVRHASHTGVRSSVRSLRIPGLHQGAGEWKSEPSDAASCLSRARPTSRFVN